VPPLILLGSFLVPVSFVAWAFEHRRDEHVTAELVVTAFVVGGILGVLGASLLETYLLHPHRSLPRSGLRPSRPRPGRAGTS
jgi:RsiW-degrading membrane proteinase PrsW (M82 family)